MRNFFVCHVLVPFVLIWLGDIWPSLSLKLVLHPLILILVLYKYSTVLVRTLLRRGPSTILRQPVEIRCSDGLLPRRCAVPAPATLRVNELPLCFMLKVGRSVLTHVKFFEIDLFWPSFTVYNHGAVWVEIRLDANMFTATFDCLVICVSVGTFAMFPFWSQWNILQCLTLNENLQLRSIFCMFALALCCTV